jgi:hypothetical protein
MIIFFKDPNGIRQVSERFVGHYICGNCKYRTTNYDKFSSKMVKSSIDSPAYGTDIFQELEYTCPRCGKITPVLFGESPRLVAGDVVRTYNLSGRSRGSKLARIVDVLRIAAVLKDDSYKIYMERDKGRFNPVEDWDVLEDFAKQEGFSGWAEYFKSVVETYGSDGLDIVAYRFEWVNR